MRDLLDSHELVLMEAAIVERLRRGGDVALHETLTNAPLIYDQRGREVLASMWGEYMGIARGAGLPFVMCTPTWRADRERMPLSGVSERLNQDAAHFMRELREMPENAGGIVRIGGLVGCKHDCYRAEEGLSCDEAERFHSWQIEQLVEGGVDFLITETVPSVSEAMGIARAMAATGMPYVIGLVIGRSGRVLDGAELMDAVDAIDAATVREPDAYMVNCAYPTFVCAERQPKALFGRLRGYAANGSALDHSELEQAAEMKAERVCDWGDAMLALNREYGVTMLGGCCGTGAEHLRYLVDAARG